MCSAFLLLSFAAFLSYSQDGLKVGTKAPDFELPSVTGKKVALREFADRKIVIVHFWKSK
jgi:peroxiredoxin